MLVKNKIFYITTLGCRTNLSESNSIYTQMINNGAINTESMERADICIINTCCVTNKAESKSRYFINKAIRSKKCELIIVIGCLSEASQEFFKHHKIGIILGNKDKALLMKYINNYKMGQQLISISNFKKDDFFEEYKLSLNTNNTRYFLKIQDGCDYMCTYCIIPFVRGRQRSLPHKTVIISIKELVSNDCKEVVLTGVNTAGYKDGKYSFYNLLLDIDKLPGDFRVRISSLEPFQINNQIINLLTTNKKR